MSTTAEAAIREQERISAYNRTERLKKQYMQAKPSLCVERAIAYTKSHKNSEGLPLIIRRAKAFREACATITVNIFDDELIVGTPGAMRRVGSLCPEISWKWLEAEMDTIQNRPQDPYELAEEQKELLKKEIFPYWSQKSLEEIILSQLPEETKNIGVETAILDSEIKWRSGVAEITPDYEDIIFKKGFKGIKNDAESQLKELDFTSYENIRKINFYKSIVEVCEGLIALGHRYAVKADKMASKEPNEMRRTELETISSICKRVPENPPRSFWEAIQTVWFVHIACFLAENGPAFNLGRFDQYMYPYYENDMKKGIITKERAQELIECLWIKLSETIWIIPENGAKYYGGYHTAQSITSGGRKKDGSDGTNELSYMTLKATENVKLNQPALAVKIDPSTPEKFLREACKLSRMGMGFPAFHCDRVGAEMLMGEGLPPAEARDWGLLGCVVPHHRKVGSWTDAGSLNMAAAMEWALNDGRSQLTGEQIGLATGDPRSFKTFEDFKNAFLKQASHLIRHAFITTIVEQIVHRENMPRPFISSIIDGCMEKGLDITEGGARFNIGPGWVMVGIADCANSIAPIKRLVYDDRKISMSELCEALKNDFDGYEQIHQMLLNFPKYGNDDDFVDQFQVELTDFAAREIKKYKDTLGLPFHTAIMGMTVNIPSGNVLGALPSGRKERVPLAEGTSPHPGTDISGPTAAMKSVAKVNHENHPGGTLLNLKFLPKAVEGEKGISALSALIRGYFDLGGYHCQFNVIDPQTLRDAQEYPEKHQDLIVRVAGYSSRFVILSKDVQDEIIRRTSHKAI